MVTFREINTVVNFTGEWKKHELFSYLQKTNVLAEQECASLILQVFDEDFGMFVDTTNDFVVPHKAKLKIKEASEFRYPGKLHDVVASALVNAYQNLKDSTGTGHDSWREALRFRAKYERRKMRQEAGETTTVAAKRPCKPSIPEDVQKRVARPYVV
ncbi:hypothetical protein HPB49_016905 [Dermacentor silvarum]|uniref:Uncharacterized protein n=1 Tax=Dermacentor silvarum TaxID=543639 RepID=A0ACB8D738_DERSI|nr:hypothetical protein HPB49_016905 [Dermacentor silvarum]